MRAFDDHLMGLFAADGVRHAPYIPVPPVGSETPQCPCMNLTMSER